MAAKRKKRKVGINQDGSLSKPWQKFFDKLDAINNNQTPVHEWDDIHILAYICKRFREHFGYGFTFSLAGPPSKCPELFCVKRMRQMLFGLNSKPQTIKEYIDWVFDNKIINRDKPLVSMGFFITASVCNEFKSNYRKSNKITKSTPLEDRYISIAESLNIDREEVATYGDVAFIKMAVDQDPESRPNYKDFLRHIKSFGFNINILEEL